jgi:hypothetical protein
MDAVLMYRKFTNWFLTATVTQPTSRKAVLKKEKIFFIDYRNRKKDKNILCVQHVRCLSHRERLSFFAGIILNVLS